MFVLSNAFFRNLFCGIPLYLIFLNKRNFLYGDALTHCIQSILRFRIEIIVAQLLYNEASCDGQVQTYFNRRVLHFEKRLLMKKKLIKYFVLFCNSLASFSQSDYAVKPSYAVFLSWSKLAFFRSECHAKFRFASVFQCLWICHQKNPWLWKSLFSKYVNCMNNFHEINPYCWLLTGQIDY